MVENPLLRQWAEDLIRAGVGEARDAVDEYCKRPKSAKRLHAARKQIARLQATLQDVTSLVPGAEDLLERVHALHRCAGEIRDADVLLDRLESYAEAGSQTLRDELRARRRKGRKNLEAALATPDWDLHP